STEILLCRRLSERSAKKNAAPREGALERSEPDQESKFPLKAPIPADRRRGRYRPGRRERCARSGWPAAPIPPLLAARPADHPTWCNCESWTLDLSMYGSSRSKDGADAHP